VLWLERPPLLRWTAAACLVVISAWFEFGPAPSSTMTFLAVDVTAGTPLTESVVERRPAAGAGFATAEPTGVAIADLEAGDPLIASMIAEVSIPDGWLVIGAPLPRYALPGMAATAIILPGESGGAPIPVPALVVEVGSTDPFGGDNGALAFPPEWLGDAAAAVAEGRLVIGVESSAR
jgi:hypothetical protein